MDANDNMTKSNSFGIQELGTNNSVFSPKQKTMNLTFSLYSKQGVWIALKTDHISFSLDCLEQVQGIAKGEMGKVLNL